MRRRILSYGLMLVTATAAAGGVAVHRLLDRPGETAFAFLPANALAVASIDIVPAPDQVLAFKSIDTLLSEANGGKPADPSGFVASMIDDPILKSLTAQIDRSAAGAWLPSPTPGGKETGVAIVAVKDPASVARILRSQGRLQNATGTEMYLLKPKNDPASYAMVNGGYLIASDKSWAVDAVGRVIRGEDRAVTSVAAFTEARSRALPSSNLLLMVHPSQVKGTEWLVGSMAIRESGFEMAVSGDTTDAEARKAGRLLPLSPDLLAHLPRGAYGFFAAAQPGPAVALVGHGLDEPAKSVKEEADLDLQADVLPALGGNVVLGLYPSFGPDAGLDLLVSIDDANGADPAKLAQKLEKAAGKAIEDSGDWMVTSTSNGTTISRLADEPTTGLQDMLRLSEKYGFRPLALSRGKTVAWASVGQGVLLATSKDLLDRAIASRRSPSAATGLAGDLAMGSNPLKAADGQFAFAIGMKRLAEGIRNTVDPSHMTPEQAKVYRRALSLYDDVKEPLALRAGMDANGRYRGYMSVPFDWSKLPALMK